MLDRDEQPLGPLGLRVISGAVQVDNGADVDRVLSLVCLDPAGRFNWAPSSPATAALYADNFLSVRYIVEDVPTVGDVEVPVFEGPITAVQRNGSQLTVTALGKESLYLAPHLAWSSQKIADRVAIDDAIRKILAAFGEKRFALDPQRLRTADPVIIATGAEPWKAAALIAANMNRQLFYDGRGRARLRNYPDPSAFAYSTGPGGSVLSPPQITYSVDRVRNAVEVLGPATKAPAKRPRVVAVAERAHPLSPWALSRNGSPRYLVNRIELDKATSRGSMQATANRSLHDALLAEVGVAFDALCIPHLEPMDIVTLVVGEQRTPFRLTQFTIPLTATDPSSVGFLTHPRITRRVS